MQLLGCSPQQDTEGLLTRIAGPEAKHCGTVRLREDHTVAIACAKDAVASGESFYILFQLHGVDSQIWVGAARRRNEPLQRVRFDSDIYGSDIPLLRWSRVSTKPCPAPEFPSSKFDRWRAARP